jgi:MFS family permease
MYLILYVDRVNIATSAPLITAELHLNNTQLGLVFSSFAIFYAVFQIIGGWIGDRLGARLTLALCGGVVMIATILTGAATGFGSLFTLRLILGLGEGAAFPTATRAMTVWIPKSRRAFAQGITHSFARGGNALTPPLIAWLIALISWRGSFVITGFATLIWLCVWAWYFRNDPREHPAITPSELAKLPAPQTIEARRIPWMRLVRRISPVTVVDFCYGWTLWLFLSWIPGFFYQNYQLNLRSSALFSAGVLFAGVVGDTAGGIVSDWILRKTGSLIAARNWVIVAGFCGALIFLIPVILIHDLSIASICLSLAFFFAELTVAPLWSVPMDIAPNYAASASGMMNFGFAIAGLVSPSSFGYLVDRTGSWVLPFIGSVIFFVIGAAFAFRLRPDLPFAEVETTSRVAKQLA